MRRILLAMMIAVLALGLSGCIVRRVPVEPQRTETREVEEFDRLSFSGYGTLLVEQGDDYELEISGPGDVVDRLEDFIAIVNACRRQR